MPLSFCGLQPLPIPPDLAGRLHPAELCLYEWKDYFLKCPGADVLRVGGQTCAPIDAASGLFQVRFQNQLGLAGVQPFAGERPLTPITWVEVLSPKFPAAAQHVAFYQALVDDLFARAARLPFAVSALTARRTVEARRPPSPLFTYHFLCQHGAALRQAVDLVLTFPHRALTENPERVRLDEVCEADADVLLELVRSTEALQPAAGLRLAHRLGGRMPARVWQRRPQETYDTPPNRFVLAFLRQVHAAAHALPAEAWWPQAPKPRQAFIAHLAARLGEAIQHPVMAGVGPMAQLPAASQVLLRREGYRDLLRLWRIFTHAHRPLFGALQHALEMRDVARLYEMWAYFALCEKLGVWLETAPALDVRAEAAGVLDWGATADFGPHGQLLYNHTFTSPASYSLPLRPDFTWQPSAGPAVVLDAKFRLEHQTWSGADTPEATARRADIYKMHTYRDALKARAAVALYPGDVAATYSAERPASALSLRAVLLGDFSGVGAFPFAPGEELE